MELDPKALGFKSQTFTNKKTGEEMSVRIEFPKIEIKSSKEELKQNS